MRADIDNPFPTATDRYLDELENRVRHLESEVRQIFVGSAIFMLSMLTIYAVHSLRLEKVEKVQNLKQGGNAANQNEDITYSLPQPAK